MSLIALTADVYSRSSRYFEGGPSHFLMYLFGRFRPVRSFMAWCLRQNTAHASFSESPLRAVVPSLAASIDVDAAVSEINRDGVTTGLTLRHDVVEQLLSYSLVATCYGEGKDENPFHYGELENAGNTYRLRRYTNALKGCPTLQSLTCDPQLLAIARKYLQSDPVLITARMWWSLAGPANSRQQLEAGQGFHSDIDGYRGLSFFFYLTDVKPSSGPHIYVRGTHKTKALKHLLSIHKSQSDAEIESRYGVAQQLSLCGPAGSGFAEDIFGFHKGLHPEEDRLVVQIRFGLQDYGSGRAD